MKTTEAHADGWYIDCPYCEATEGELTDPEGEHTCFSCGKKFLVTGVHI